MRVIRPSATTTLTAVSSSPARSIRAAGAPFSHTVPSIACGAIVLKRERSLATRSRPATGRRTAAAAPHLDVAGLQRRQEPVDHLLLLGTIDLDPRPPRGHVIPGAVRDLPDRGR